MTLTRRILDTGGIVSSPELAWKKMGGLRMMRKAFSGGLCVLVGVSSLLTGSTLSRGGSLDPAPNTRPLARAVQGAAAAGDLPLIPGREIIRELEDAGRFKPTAAFYAGHMGRTYDAAMAVVSRGQHYMKLGDDDTYLDPTTEAHESLHAMSSLIRGARGWSISQGYDVVYVGRGQFAAVRIGAGITKGDVSPWLPRQARRSEIVKTHMGNPSYRKGHVVLVVEELAYHLLDARIGLENHSYMEQKLRITSAVTAPAAEWSVVALAAATMLDRDPEGFRRKEDRVEFNLLIKRLVEESVAAYAQGMNGEKYGRLANLVPELRLLFTYLMTEDSRQARDIRDFCAKTFGKAWLPGLVDRVETARQATEPMAYTGIYNP